MPTNRLEAFSDGVFAIAITLLVLEVRVPEAAEGHLAAALRHAWPSYAAYLVSFLVIGIIWVNHHAVFERVVAVNRPLLFCNLALLAAVSFLPFPTDLLATYLRDDENGHVAAAVYSGSMALVGLTYSLVWNYAASHRDLLDPAVAVDDHRRVRRESLIGPACYLVAIGLSFVNAMATLAVHAALAVFFATRGTRWMLKEEGRGASEE